MEIAIVRSENAPEGCLLSLSAGGSRRQAPLVPRQKFAFGHSSLAAAVAPGGSGLKLEVLVVQGLTRLCSKSLMDSLPAGADRPRNVAKREQKHVEVFVPQLDKAGQVIADARPVKVSFALSRPAVNSKDPSARSASARARQASPEDQNGMVQQTSQGSDPTPAELLKTPSLLDSSSRQSARVEFSPPPGKTSKQSRGSSPPRSSRRHTAALEARSYLEEHSILPFVERVLRTLVQERPPDPWHAIETLLPRKSTSPPKAPTSPMVEVIESSAQEVSSTTVNPCQGSSKELCRQRPSVGTWFSGRCACPRSFLAAPSRGVLALRFSVANALSENLSTILESGIADVTALVLSEGANVEVARSRVQILPYGTGVDVVANLQIPSRVERTNVEQSLTGDEGRKILGRIPRELEALPGIGAIKHDASCDFSICNIEVTSEFHEARVARGAQVCFRDDESKLLVDCITPRFASSQGCYPHILSCPKHFWENVYRRFHDRCPAVQRARIALLAASADGRLVRALALARGVESHRVVPLGGEAALRKEVCDILLQAGADGRLDSAIGQVHKSRCEVDLRTSEGECQTASHSLGTDSIVSFEHIPEMEALTVVELKFNHLSLAKLASMRDVCRVVLRQLKEAVAEQVSVSVDSVELELPMRQECLSVLATIHASSTQDAHNIKVAFDHDIPRFLKQVRARVMRVSGIEACIPSRTDDVGLTTLSSSVQCKLTSRTKENAMATASTALPGPADTSFGGVTFGRTDNSCSGDSSSHLKLGTSTEGPQSHTQAAVLHGSFEQRPTVAMLESALGPVKEHAQEATPAEGWQGDADSVSKGSVGKSLVAMTKSVTPPASEGAQTFSDSAKLASNADQSIDEKNTPNGDAENATNKYDATPVEAIGEDRIASAAGAGGAVIAVKSTEEDKRNVEAMNSAGRILAACVPALTFDPYMNDGIGTSPMCSAMTPIRRIGFEGAVKQEEAPEEEHQAVTFQVLLEEHSQDCFDEAKQRDLCLHISGNLGCDCTEILNIASGSIIAGIQTIGFLNEQHARDAGKKIEAGNAIQESIWGRHKLVSSPVQTTKLYRASPWLLTQRAALMKRDADVVAEHAHLGLQGADAAMASVADRSTRADEERDCRSNLTAGVGRDSLHTSIEMSNVADNEFAKAQIERDEAEAIAASVERERRLADVMATKAAAALTAARSRLAIKDAEAAAAKANAEREVVEASIARAEAETKKAQASAAKARAEKDSLRTEIASARAITGTEQLSTEKIVDHTFAEKAESSTSAGQQAVAGPMFGAACEDISVMMPKEGMAENATEQSTESPRITQAIMVSQTEQQCFASKSHVTADSVLSDSRTAKKSFGMLGEKTVASRDADVVEARSTSAGFAVADPILDMALGDEGTMTVSDRPTEQAGVHSMASLTQVAKVSPTEEQVFASKSAVAAGPPETKMFVEKTSSKISETMDASLVEAPLTSAAQTVANATLDTALDDEGIMTVGERPTEKGSVHSMASLTQIVKVSPTEELQVASKSAAAAGAVSTKISVESSSEISETAEASFVEVRSTSVADPILDIVLDDDGIKTVSEWPTEKASAHSIASLTQVANISPTEEPLVASKSAAAAGPTENKMSVEKISVEISETSDASLVEACLPSAGLGVTDSSLDVAPEDVETPAIGQSTARADTIQGAGASPTEEQALASTSHATAGLVETASRTFDLGSACVVQGNANRASLTHADSSTSRHAHERVVLATPPSPFAQASSGMPTARRIEEIETWEIAESQVGSIIASATVPRVYGGEVEKAAESPCNSSLIKDPSKHGTTHRSVLQVPPETDTLGKICTGSDQHTDRTRASSVQQSDLAEAVVQGQDQELSPACQHAKPPSILTTPQSESSCALSTSIVHDIGRPSSGGNSVNSSCAAAVARESELSALSIVAAADSVALQSATPLVRVSGLFSWQCEQDDAIVSNLASAAVAAVVPTGLLPTLVEERHQHLSSDEDVVDPEVGPPPPPRRKAKLSAGTSAMMSDTPVSLPFLPVPIERASSEVTSAMVSCPEEHRHGDESPRTFVSEVEPQAERQSRDLSCDVISKTVLSANVQVSSLEALSRDSCPRFVDMDVSVLPRTDIACQVETNTDTAVLLTPSAPPQATLTEQESHDVQSNAGSVGASTAAGQANAVIDRICCVAIQTRSSSDAKSAVEATCAEQEASETNNVVCEQSRTELNDGRAVEAGREEDEDGLVKSGESKSVIPEHFESFAPEEHIVPCTALASERSEGSDRVAPCDVWELSISEQHEAVESSAVLKAPVGDYHERADSEALGGARKPSLPTRESAEGHVSNEQQCKSSKLIASIVGRSSIPGHDENAIIAAPSASCKKHVTQEGSSASDNALCEDRNECAFEIASGPRETGSEVACQEDAHEEEQGGVRPEPASNVDTLTGSTVATEPCRAAESPGELVALEDAEMKRVECTHSSLAMLAKPSSVVSPRGQLLTRTTTCGTDVPQAPLPRDVSASVNVGVTDVVKDEIHADPSAAAAQKILSTEADMTSEGDHEILSCASSASPTAGGRSRARVPQEGGQNLPVREEGAAVVARGTTCTSVALAAVDKGPESEPIDQASPVASTEQSMVDLPMMTVSALSAVSQSECSAFTVLSLDGDDNIGVDSSMDGALDAGLDEDTWGESVSTTLSTPISDELRLGAESLKESLSRAEREVAEAKAVAEMEVAEAEAAKVAAERELAAVAATKAMMEIDIAQAWNSKKSAESDASQAKIQADQAVMEALAAKELSEREVSEMLAAKAKVEEEMQALLAESKAQEDASEDEMYESEDEGQSQESEVSEAVSGANADTSNPYSLADQSIEGECRGLNLEKALSTTMASETNGGDVVCESSGFQINFDHRTGFALWPSVGTWLRATNSKTACRAGRILPHHMTLRQNDTHSGESSSLRRRTGAKLTIERTDGRRKSRQESTKQADADFNHTLRSRIDVPSFALVPSVGTWLRFVHSRTARTVCSRSDVKSITSTFACSLRDTAKAESRPGCAAACHSRPSMEECDEPSADGTGAKPRLAIRDVCTSSSSSSSLKGCLRQLDFDSVIVKRSFLCAPSVGTWLRFSRGRASAVMTQAMKATSNAPPPALNVLTIYEDMMRTVESGNNVQRTSSSFKFAPSVGSWLHLARVRSVPMRTRSTAGSETRRMVTSTHVEAAVSLSVATCLQPARRGGTSAPSSILPFRSFYLMHVRAIDTEWSQLLYAKFGPYKKIETEMLFTLPETSGETCLVQTLRSPSVPVSAHLSVCRDVALSSYDSFPLRRTTEQERISPVTAGGLVAAPSILFRHQPSVGSWFTEFRPLNWAIDQLFKEPECYDDEEEDYQFPLLDRFESECHLAFYAHESLLRANTKLRMELEALLGLATPDPTPPGSNRFLDHTP
eukprot:TRINITY_DN5333_c0_g1_i2.p1 TRINITY_DN5333_c0_g1~~TRINITY_DN5333_c0_g1_i2.p1  ORF type:complete len:3415 (+),score=520.67 TRINITY_DN5333_c0_g1_i2:150-10394(+)